MTERLTIARMGHRGDGVAEGPSGPIHVAFTLPGETVTVDPITGHADRKHLLHVDVASPDRIAPVCAHFGVCGGCAVQHWTSDRYRAWKRQIVVAALAAAGLDPPVEDLVDAHGEGRRRMVLHARRGVRDILQVGFAAPRAHHVVPIDRCPILAPGLASAIPIAWKLAEALQPLRKPLDLQFTATDTGLDVDVRGSGPLSPQREAALARIATDNRLARLTRHGELVAQSVAPTIRMGRSNVPLPPGSFLQATAAAEAILAQRVVTHLGAAARVADLFCGVGPFALRVAETARVTACDSDQNATAALQRAASGASGLKPIDPVTRDLFRQPLLPEELKPFDAVVFDPPRAGAMTQAVQLAASRVPLIIGVSCNPGTFARDARILVDGGYRLVGVAPVDQFRHSHHVELVARFERG